MRGDTMILQHVWPPAPLELALLELEEKAWEQVYLANRDDFRAMAHEALVDLDAGDTLEMINCKQDQA